MSTLQQASAAVNAAITAINGDEASTRQAIEALIAKQNAANSAIQSSLAALRDVVVNLANSLADNGAAIDPSLVTEAEAIVVPDFDGSDGSSTNVTQA